MFCQTGIRWIQNRVGGGGIINTYPNAPVFACCLFTRKPGIVPRLNYAPPSYSVPVCHASLFFTHKAHRILAMHTEEKQPLTIPNSIGRENSKMEGIW